MVIHVTKENFEKEVKNSDTPYVVIDFFAEWCGPCKMLGPVFEEVSKEFEGKLKFVKVNVEEAPELANEFGVRGVPMLVVLKDGNKIKDFVGYQPKEVLKQKLEDAIK